MNLQEQIFEAIKQDEKWSIEKLANNFEVGKLEIMQNLPFEIAKVISGEHFDELMNEIEGWSEVLIVKNTPNFIFEVQSALPKGSYAHGYYNLSHKAPLGGHIKVDSIKNIVFLSAKIVMGILSHSIIFLDENGEDIFKIYVSRDEKRNFIPEQLEKFMALKEKFSK